MIRDIFQKLVVPIAYLVNALVLFANGIAELTQGKVFEGFVLIALSMLLVKEI